MPDKSKINYFHERAKLAMRDAELTAYFQQTSLIGPILEALAEQSKALERIALTLERIAIAYETHLGAQGIGTREEVRPEPESSPEFDPEYTDEIADALSETIKITGLTPIAATGAIAALYGGEEKKQWTPETIG